MSRRFMVRAVLAAAGVLAVSASNSCRRRAITIDPSVADRQRLFRAGRLRGGWRGHLDHGRHTPEERPQRRLGLRRERRRFRRRNRHRRDTARRFRPVAQHRRRSRSCSSSMAPSTRTAPRRRSVIADGADIHPGGAQQRRQRGGGLERPGHGHQVRRHDRGGHRLLHRHGPISRMRSAGSISPRSRAATPFAGAGTNDSDYSIGFIDVAAQNRRRPAWTAPAPTGCAGRRPGFRPGNSMNVQQSGRLDARPS